MTLIVNNDTRRGPWRSIVELAASALPNANNPGFDEYDLCAYVVRTTLGNECDCMCGRVSEESLTLLATSFGLKRHEVAKELQMKTGQNVGKRAYYRFIPDMRDEAIVLGNSLQLSRAESALLACRLGMTGIIAAQIAKRVPAPDALAYVHCIRDSSEAGMRELTRDMHSAAEYANFERGVMFGELLRMHGYPESTVLTGATIAGLSSHLRGIWSTYRSTTGTNEQR